MVKTIYFNHQGNLVGGGPSVWSYKAAKEFVRRGIKVIYEHPERSDWAIAIIETGKLRRQVANKQTKILLRTDGIYNEEYNKLFGRAIRPDMSALHNKLKSDIPNVDYVVYQSLWSKNRIDEEIVVRNKHYSIISNGADLNLFRPIQVSKMQELNLLHLGKIRDGYLMKTIVGVFKEIKNRGIKANLLLAGTMDAECLSVFNSNKDDGMYRLGSFPNNKLSEVYARGDIFLDVRQGASCNNVVAEAQACGLPVVCSGWGGSVDMIKHKETGMIVETGHWAYDQSYVVGIADAIQEICKDLNGFKLRSRKHAEEELSIERMVDKYLEAMAQ